MALNNLTIEDWLAAKAGILNESDLVAVEHLSDKYTQYYVCPCGDKDHYAVRRLIIDGLQWSVVVNCLEKMLQWAVRPPTYDIVGIIEQEEIKYAKVIERADKIVPKEIKKRGDVPETYAFLKDSHGIEEELAKEIWERQ